MKKIITLILSLILLTVNVYSEETPQLPDELCRYTGPHLNLINEHIWREGNQQQGVLKQCIMDQHLLQDCGWCGTRNKECGDPPGIWGISWSTCYDQGYCDPNKELDEYLAESSHLDETTCNQNDKTVAYVEVKEKNICGGECTYSDAIRTPTELRRMCVVGYCGATCTEEDLGIACAEQPCGTLSCTNCEKQCVANGVCYDGQERRAVCKTGQEQDPNDFCGIEKQTCDGTCQWNAVTCAEMEQTELGCDSTTFGNTKPCGNCGTQTCEKDCPQGPRDEDASYRYYWGDCIGQKTHTANTQLPDILKNSESYKGCEGENAVYVKIYETQSTDANCNIVKGTREEPLRKTREVGKCGVCTPGHTKDIGGTACGKQKSTCNNNGYWIDDPVPRQPTAEVCDGVDNDCDGQTDEGACQVEINPPEDIPPHIDPAPIVVSRTENTQATCSDGKDNDQDGLIDMEDPSCECKSGSVDINGNGRVDKFDLAEFFKANGKCDQRRTFETPGEITDYATLYLADKPLNKDPTYNPRADFDGDGCVGNPGYPGKSKSMPEVSPAWESGDSSCFGKFYNIPLDCSNGCPDLNGDGKISIADVAILAKSSGACIGDGNYNPAADFDNNGCVMPVFQHGADINCITRLFGQSFEPDKDGDGFVAPEFAGCSNQPVDCDDNNKDYNPNTPELCNDKDDNCNGQIDEGAPPTSVNIIGRARPVSGGITDVGAITDGDLSTAGKRTSGPGYLIYKFSNRQQIDQIEISASNLEPGFGTNGDLLVRIYDCDAYSYDYGRGIYRCMDYALKGMTYPNAVKLVDDRLISTDRHNFAVPTFMGTRTYNVDLKTRYLYFEFPRAAHIYDIKIYETKCK